MKYQCFFFLLLGGLFSLCAPAFAQADSLLMARYQRCVEDYFDAYERGQVDSAELALRSALSILPTYGGNFLLEANLAELVVARCDTVEALGLLTSALNRQPHLDTIRSRRAELLTQSRRLEDALADLDELLKQYPKSEIYRYRRALLLRDLGLPEGAVADLQKIVEHNPKAYIPQVTLAEVLFDQGENLRAEQILTRLIDEYPQQHMAARVLTKCYLKSDQKAQALATIRKAINSGTRVTAEEYLVRGMVWLAYGEQKEAEKDFGKAKELGANDRSVHDANAWVHDMRQGNRP